MVASTDGPFSPELASLAALAPGAHAALVRAWWAAYDEVNPELLDLVRRRVEDQLGIAPADVEEAQTDLQRAVVALVDQFVFHVSDVGPELLEPVQRGLGRPGLEQLVQALYVVDQVARLRASFSRLLTDRSDPPVTASDQTRSSSLRSAIRELHSEAMLLPELDPLTTEVLRLRAANYHDCKT